VGKPLLTQLVAAYMLLMGLLMVSRVRYPHLSNKLLGERKRVGHLVAAIFLFFLLVQIPIYLLAVGFNAYAVYGLACAVVHRLRRGLRRRSPAADAPGGDSADEEPPADAAQTAPSERSAP
jgi:phosphatidylserine synthase